MKRFFAYLIPILFLSILVSLSLLYYFKYDFEKNDLTISPIPEFLTISKNKQVRLLDLWSPIVSSSVGSGFNPESLSAKSAIVFDLTTNKTIFEKSATTKYPMASLTKIMTAVISLENKKYNNRYVVKKEDLVGENSMGLAVGEILSLEELLYGLMLPSGNDAAEVLANNFQTGRSGFIQAMNLKAKSLGLNNTHFDNPSGLQGDGEQFTTSYDLLVITRYALENFPLFAKIVSTPEYHIIATRTHQPFDLYNETNLLTSYEGVKGVKTGYTPEAGLCLVTYIEFKGHKIIGVILNSENRRSEMKNLLDYSFKTLGVAPPEYKGNLL